MTFRTITEERHRTLCSLAFIRYMEKSVGRKREISENNRFLSESFQSLRKYLNVHRSKKIKSSGPAIFSSVKCLQKNQSRNFQFNAFPVLNCGR